MLHASYDEWQLMGRYVRSGEKNIGFIEGIAQFNEYQTELSTHTKRSKREKPIKGSDYKLSRPRGNTRPTKIYQ